ncbi:MAG: autotransporter outer membrane beta-barrel domain-containing protein [Alphaproteobacteria bacterium]|nr:autotransporter outer membrane beta-barrel domain-containing protein [Alphaproteobacteria bacterium]MCL2757921.1 autotransporter outer membrane beta-barrel domain-containing protein [Alphaproteobacteria bacterium]
MKFLKTGLVAVPALAAIPMGAANADWMALATPGQIAIYNAINSAPSTNSNFNTIKDHIESLLVSVNPLNNAIGIAALSAFVPPTAPQVHAVSTTTAAQVFDAAGTRLTGGAMTPMGEPVHNFIIGNTEIWAQGLASRARFTGDDAFNTTSFGATFGVETNLTRSLKFGAGYAYTNTTVKPDIKESNIQSHSVLGYAEWKAEDWFVNTVASFTFGRQAEDKKIAGVGVTGSRNLDMFAVQSLVGHEIHGRDLTFVPRAGFRYLNVWQEGYTDNAGSYTTGANVDFLTGIAGMKFTFEWERRTRKYGALWPHGPRIRPEAYIGATYDFITDAVNSRMIMANGAVIDIEGDTLYRVAIEAGAGLTMSTVGGIGFTVGYMGRFRQDYTDSNVMLSIKYAF